MVGRATDAEKLRQRKQLNQVENTLESTENIKRENGTETTSNIPDNITFEPEETKKTVETGKPIDPVNAQILESRYDVLFNFGGFELIDHIENYGTINEDDYKTHLPALTSLAENHNLVESQKGVIKLSDTGKNIYQNWKGFQDYLSNEERYKKITEDLRDPEVAKFINTTTDTDTSIHHFLRDRDRAERNWVRGYDAEDEFYEITSVLYSEEAPIGQSVEQLYQLQQGEGLLEENQQTYSQGLNGLLEGDGLNYDGEALYRRVKFDELGL